MKEDNRIWVVRKDIARWIPKWLLKKICVEIAVTSASGLGL